MARVEIIKPLHLSTPRDYAARRNDPARAANCLIAKEFGPDYWDGDRKFGYGGYRYDGRWRPVAEALAERYRLAAGSTVLDVGCGKGFLLYELMQVVPGVKVSGFDASPYAIENAHPDVQNRLWVERAESVQCDREPAFDLVISVNALHNLRFPDLLNAISRISWLGRQAYICVESWSTEQERLNMLDWQLTCEAFHDMDAWESIGGSVGYRGDWEFITFP